MADTAKQPEKKAFSFYMYPDVKIENQGRDEEIVLMIRAHPITQIGWALNSIGLLIVLFLLNLFLPNFFNLSQIIYINLLGLGVIFGYIWYNFLSWYFNVGVVTNKRIVDIDFYYVLYKEVSATTLDHVEDVTSKSGGFFESFFHYGDVFVQTAGEEENIEFLNAPNPSRIVEIINNLTSQ